jgi:hypothetical protein
LKFHVILGTDVNHLLTFGRRISHRLFAENVDAAFGSQFGGQHMVRRDFGDDGCIHRFGIEHFIEICIEARTL